MACSIISHRGANTYAPQNTIPAFKKSLEIGVDGFETDVHCTKDGKLIICHNYTVDETSNGTGKVEEMTFDELRKLDFGSYFSSEFAGTQLPTIDEFLECSVSDEIKIMNIEIKAPENGDITIADKTIAAVKEHGLFDKLLISSFSPEILVQCKKVDKNCKTGFLYSPQNKICYTQMLFNYAGFLKEIGCEYSHPHFSLVNEHYVKKLHQNGIGVNPWTVDTVARANRLKKIGCDGIITNCPDLIK